MGGVSSDMTYKTRVYGMAAKLNWALTAGIMLIIISMLILAKMVHVKSGKRSANDSVSLPLN